MSEKLLKALMQLFAIVADVDDLSNKSRQVVELFLKQQLSQEMVEEYMKVYDEYLEKHHKLSAKKEGKRKRTSVNSVKVLKICTQINSELTQKQKVVVLIRVLEYLHSDNFISEQEMEFAYTVAETFNISKEEFEGAVAFITATNKQIPDKEDFLLISPTPVEKQKIKNIPCKEIDASVLIYNFTSVGMLVLRYFGNADLYLNGQVLSNEQAYILTPGSSIRSSKVNPIYYSDILSQFLSDKTTEKLVFTANNITYTFKNGKIGLHPLTFSEESGKLLGIMGGSGAGKSTLLNVLNGENPPSSGKVTINGIDIHHEKEKIEGVIGYVSQDDLLIEELTVFQNLYYNAKLCFDGWSDLQIKKKVLRLLMSLGLYEAKDLKVGNPLQKTISGGQRKRLNIALELIREPSVLFVDEPTSGLSSRDSENIMDLLKELALKGKLVFVVIHQPSSDIFKMFDKLLILDLGGYPIYWGNPVDAVIYFKELINHVNSQESECPVCGNVNPEQIFNIIESKVLDEYGNVTEHRKISPKEWYQFYKERIAKDIEILPPYENIPKSTFNIPNKIKQFKVFLVRDVLSKLTNKQYLAINLLEAPVLAFVLSYLVRYYNTDIHNTTGYIFRENSNIVAYMFMAVVVALFVGMTLSAEEIIRDQKIRKRESFLNLSKISYLSSKVLIMFAISAIQMFTFVIIGNLILGIKGMFFPYWVILFTTACFANMLGLNVSATFNSVVTIYISIPILLIPQLLLSGVIVKFDKLNPTITSQKHVPVVGELMTSRWAFEALAVYQFKNNEFEKHFYPYDKDLSISGFRKNFWLSEMKKKLGIVQNNLSEKGDKQSLTDALLVLRNEIAKEELHTPKIVFKEKNKLTPENIDGPTIHKLKKHFNLLNKYYIKKYNRALDKKDEIVSKMQKDLGKEKFNELKDNYENDNLSDLVRNRSEINKIIEVNHEFIQRTDPIFLDPDSFRAHFYAPRKLMFNRYYETFWFNNVVVWIFSILLMITLYFDVFKNIVEGIGKLFEKILSKS